MSNELKRCPLCGRKMEVGISPFFPRKYGIVHVDHFDFSDMCYGGTDYIYKSKYEAVEAWNSNYGKG